MASYIKELIFYSALMLFIFFAAFSKAEARETPYYFGISGGQTQVKNTSTQQYQDATSLGLKVGVRIFENDSVWTGSELKYTKTTAKQEVTVSGTSTTSKYEVATTGLYLVGRTIGSIYVKGKVGASHRLISINDATTQETTRGSAGVGLGIRQGGAIMEIEYTQYGEDVTIVSVGYVF